MKTLRFLKALLIFAILFIIHVSASEIHDAYYVGEVVSVTSIVFKDSYGTEVRTLPSSGSLCAETTALNMSDDNEKNVTLIIAAYKNGVLVEAKYGETILKEKYSSELKTPYINVSGVDEVKSFVCSNLADMHPYAVKALLSENNIKIKNLYIDNEPLSNFDENVHTYNIILSPGYSDFPVISPDVEDSSIKCKIDYNGIFPLNANESATAELNFISSDESTIEKYKLVFTQQQPEITNVKSSAATAVTVYKNLRNLTFTTTPKMAYSTQELVDGYGWKYFDDYIPVYNDRMYPIINIPEPICGSYFVNVNKDYNDKFNYTLGNDTMKNGVSFDINKTADIYIVVNDSRSEWLKTQGFTLSTDFTPAFISANETQGRVFEHTNLFKKTVEVENDSIKTIELGPICYAIVKFKDNPNVEKAVMKTSATASEELSVISEIYNADYYKEWEYKYTGSIDNIRTGINNISNKKDYYVIKFPETITEGECIAFPFNFRSKYTTARYTENTDFITFDIQRSSTVYVFYPANISEIKWMQTEDFDELNKSEFLLSFLCNGNISFTNGAFKKDYEVNPGEKLTVKLGGFPVASGSNVPLTLLIVPKVK